MNSQPQWLQEQLQLHGVNGQEASAWFQDQQAPRQPTTNGFEQHTTQPQFTVENGFDHQQQPQYIPQYHAPGPQQHQLTQPQAPPTRTHLNLHHSYDAPTTYAMQDVNNNPSGHTPAGALSTASFYAQYPATSGSYAYQAPAYSPSPPVDHQRNHYQPQPTYLTTYSSLNGATSTSSIPPSTDSHSQITIDPALVSISPTVTKQYPPAQSSLQPHPTYATTISPSSLHAAIPPAHQQQYYSTPAPITPQLPPAAQPPPQQTQLGSTPNPVPTPAPSRRNQEATVRELLSARSLEKSPAVAASSLIKILAQIGISETAPALRKEILNSMRDNAGKEFFESWAKNPDGMETFRVWLKAASTRKDASGRREVEETLMPLLNVIDRLPLGLEELRTSRIGKVIKTIVSDPPSGAAKDMASVLTQKWTNLIAQQKKVDEDSSTPSSTADLKGKKRKAPELPLSKVPPAKKPAPSTSGSAATGSSSSVATVKKESIKAEPVTTKAAKSDSSFFSTPKKKVLPSFKKVPVGSNVKKEDVASVSQPLNFNPYQEALKDLAIKAPSTATPPTQTPTPTPAVGERANSSGLIDVVGNTGTSSLSVDVNMKHKKSVTFAPEGQLEMIKWISRADYPDDKPENSYSLNDLKALDRDEGRALHHHVFQEVMDWTELLLIEFPLDPDFPVLEPRGGESVEAGVQEEREKNTLIASYMSPSRIPDTASDLHPGIGDTNPDDPPTVMMLPGAEVSGLNAEDLPPSTLSDLLAQIAAPSVASGQGTAPASATFDAWGQQPQPPQASTSTSVSLLQQFGLSGMTSVDFSNLLSTVSPETIGLMQQQPSHPFNSGFSSQPQGFGGGDQAYWSDPSGGASQPSWGGTSEGWNDNHNGNGGSGNFGRGRGRGRGFGGGRGRGGGFDRPKKLCNFFAKGYCRFGEACDFWHDPSLAHLQQKS